MYGWPFACVRVYLITDWPMPRPMSSLPIELGQFVVICDRFTTAVRKIICNIVIGQRPLFALDGKCAFLHCTIRNARSYAQIASEWFVFFYSDQFCNDAPFFPFIQNYTHSVSNFYDFGIFRNLNVTLSCLSLSCWLLTELKASFPFELLSFRRKECKHCTCRDLVIYEWWNAHVFNLFIRKVWIEQLTHDA